MAQLSRTVSTKSGRGKRLGRGGRSLRVRVALLLVVLAAVEVLTAVGIALAWPLVRVFVAVVLAGAARSGVVLAAVAMLRAFDVALAVKVFVVGIAAVSACPTADGSDIVAAVAKVEALMVAEASAVAHAAAVLNGAIVAVLVVVAATIAMYDTKGIAVAQCVGPPLDAALPFTRQLIFTARARKVAAAVPKIMAEGITVAAGVDGIGAAPDSTGAHGGACRRGGPRRGGRRA